MALHKYMSNEEWYFSWWLKEMEEAGYIGNVEYQPKPFPICDPVKKEYKVFQKRKGLVTKQFSLLQGSQYTADWAWGWTPKAANIFFALLPDLNPKDFPFIPNMGKASGWTFSVVDIKGTFNENNNTRMFSMNQKIIYEKYEIYVQKIITKPAIKVDKDDPTKITITPKSALFNATFTPERYLLTDAKTKQRKIQFEIRTLKEFVDVQRHKLEAIPGRVQNSNQNQL